jgi:hypothetical protein
MGSGAIPRKCVFYRQMVFWALCRQDCGPKLASGKPKVDVDDWKFSFSQRIDRE